MISDFGLSKTEESGAMATACGTPGYVGKYQSLLVVLQFHREYSQLYSFEKLLSLSFLHFLNSSFVWIVVILIIAHVFFCGSSTGSTCSTAVWQRSRCLVNWCDCIHTVCTACITCTYFIWNIVKVRFCIVAVFLHFIATWQVGTVVSHDRCGSFCGSVCLCQSVCLSVCLCLFVCGTVCLSVGLYFCLSVSVCLSVGLRFCLSVCLSVSVSQSVCLSLSVCLSVSLSVRGIVVLSMILYVCGSVHQNGPIYFKLDISELVSRWYVASTSLWKKS